MRVGFKAKMLASLAVGAIVALGSLPVKADDTSAEIAVLKAELRRLEAKVDAQAKSAAQTKAQIAAYPVPTRKGEEPLLACPPGKFCYKGLTITPGGFFALEGLYRNHNLESDIDTSWNTIPFPNNKVGHTTESRLSERQSRLSLLVEGKVDPVTSLAGYGEFDFLGAAQTANSNESNSFQPRVRHLYATIDRSDWGLHVLAGQTWSLATLSSQGMVPRKEQIPLSIDAQYVPGFTWTRTPELRVVKDFGPFSVGVSAENSASTFSGSLPGAAAVVATSLNGCGGGAGVNPSGDSLLNACNTYSINTVPDFIGKATFDSAFADHKVHLEGYGLLRDFYDRTDPAVPTAASGFTGTGNHSTFGGGFGGGIVAELMPKIVDVQFSGLTGVGIGRYGTSGLPDATYNSVTGAITPIPETQLLAGVIVHAMPGLDIYGYAGEEIAGQKYNPKSVSGFGYGNPASINAGCINEFSAAACVGNTKSIQQLTIGFWQTIYKGDFGMFRAGLQYSDTQKTGFAGAASAAPATFGTITPKASEQVFMTSLRYYPF